jgi:hypothetical protein
LEREENNFRRRRAEEDESPPPLSIATMECPSPFLINPKIFERRVSPPREATGAYPGHAIAKGNGMALQYLAVGTVFGENPP